MTTRFPRLALTAICLAMAPSCRCKRAEPAPDAAQVKAPPTMAVTVAVSTEPRYRPRLTLGPGLPGTGRPRPQALGSLKLTAERCRLEGASFLSTRKDPPVRGLEVVGQYLYAIAHQGAVLRFHIVPGAKCRLRLDKTWGKAGVHRAGFGLERLSADGRGTLVASGYLGSLVIRGGRVVYRCQAKNQGHVALHPQGGWGLAAYSGSDVQRLVFGPTSCTGTPWHLRSLRDDVQRRGPFRLVSALAFWGDTILVGGSLALRVQGWHPQVVVAFDKQGRQRFQLGALTGHGPKRFGWIQAVGTCGSNHICVIDSNLGRLTLWDKAGRFLGASSLSGLLGLSSPWLTNFAVASPDTAYLAAGPGGARVELSEGAIYRVGGLAGARP